MEKRRSWLRTITDHSLGFRLEERMKGSHRFLRDFSPTGIQAGAELPLEFEVRWGHERLDRFLNPLGSEFLRASLVGSITASGLCVDAPLRGNLELRYLADQTLRYSFEFPAHGRTFRYTGEKRELRPWNLHRTHTTCYGSLLEAESGEMISTSVVRFALQDLPRLLASLRLGRRTML